MAINPFHFVLAVHRPQRPKSEVGPIRCGKLSKPIYAAMFTNPVPRLHMKGVGVFGKPRDLRTDAEGVGPVSRKLFAARPMPELISPVWELQFAATGNRPAFVR